jgi:hypothetical protein
LGTVVSGANGLSILAEEEESPLLFLDIDDDLLLDNFVYFGVPAPLLVDNTLAFFAGQCPPTSIMESEPRFLDNDGLLKLVVDVVDSNLADLAPRKAGRFGASRSEKKSTNKHGYH